jgi:NAD+ kinase
MRIALFGRSFSEHRNEVVSELYKGLLDKGHQLIVFESFLSKTKSLLPSEKSVETFGGLRQLTRCDLMISIGGDGTLLEAVTHVRNSGVPILGINTGRLGFLTAFSAKEIGEAIKRINDNALFTEKRTLLELETEPNPFLEFPYALNEITLHKKDNSSMITLAVYRNGELLNNYWADGLIISTATGSTGYSLSCGGPIMLPASQNFIITPIAPHNLNVRPLVISDEDLLEIRPQVRGKEIMISLDSRSASISALQPVSLRKAPFSIELVRKEQGDFLHTLREKLMWGTDKRN